MTDAPPQIAPPPGPAPRFPWRGPVDRFGLALPFGAAACAALASTLVGGAAPAVALALAGYGAGAWLALALLRRGFPHGSLGLCNLVTLARLAMTAALLAPLAAPPQLAWGIVALAILALALDGVDGWLARREGRISSFGARFDMEVDSALALILALNAWASGSAGAAVLLIGLPRYAFALAAVLLPWLDRPLPERRSRKTVCVLQLATLIALQLPNLPRSVADPLVAAVAVALIWSFWTDLRWLWRTRP